MKSMNIETHEDGVQLLNLHIKGWLKYWQANKVILTVEMRGHCVFVAFLDRVGKRRSLTVKIQHNDGTFHGDLNEKLFGILAYLIKNADIPRAVDSKTLVLQ